MKVDLLVGAELDVECLNAFGKAFRELVERVRRTWVSIATQNFQLDLAQVEMCESGLPKSSASEIM